MERSVSGSRPKAGSLSLIHILIVKKEWYNGRCQVVVEFLLDNSPDVMQPNPVADHKTGSGSDISRNKFINSLLP